ncbi:MAG TPA: hypothetical protein VHC97_27465 [Thermoanaerobaculia bacterium]|jgi:cbb3-type cytochrome oxidase subunit 3|nr:hypothetical protein [Thermoanaerobaculia bacterium]
MERVLAESGVERTAVPPETSYLGELFRAARRALVDALLAGAERLHVPASVVKAFAWGLAALAILLIAWGLFTRWQRRRRKEGDEGSVAALSLPPVARDAAAWRAELERLLAEGAEGRVAEALEALWWWLARSLAGDRAEPDWTSRDLMVKARREDLRDLVRRLDAFTYGPRPPGVDDLRGLVGRLEEALS